MTGRVMVYVYAVGVLAGLGLVLSALIQLAEKLLADYGVVTVRVNNEKEFAVEGGVTLLDILYGNRVFIPSACGGKGTCGFCKVSVIDGGGPVLPTETPFLTPAERTSGVRLACQVKVKEDLAARVRPEYLSVREFCAKVVSAAMLTHDVREIRLGLVEPSEIDFRAGQYVQVSVPGRGEPVFRAYSVASAPEERREIELLVRLVPGGVCSTYLHGVEPGDEVTFTGPYGEFDLDEDESTELVLVAGGCGIAPIRSIIRHVCAGWPDRRSWLFFGARSEEDLFNLDEFRGLADTHPGFEFHCALSAPAPADEWDGEVGFIHESVERHMPSVRGKGKRCQAFLCGPKPMLEASIRVLRAKGVRGDRIYYDEF